MNKINLIFDNLVKKLNKYKYTQIITDIIINGNVPYFNLIRKYLVFISIFGVFIFLFPQLYKDFGEYAYNLLIIILLISPLSKITPKIKIINKIVILRRPIGIIIGFFLIAHLIGFFLTHDLGIIQLIKNEIFNFGSFYFWGIRGTIFAIFPFITSNNLSQKLLKTKWKLFQYGTYLFFIFSTLHIYVLKGDIEELGFLIIWVLLKILAYKKVVILK